MEDTLTTKTARSERREKEDSKLEIVMVPLENSTAMRVKKLQKRGINSSWTFEAKRGWARTKTLEDDALETFKLYLVKTNIELNISRLPLRTNIPVVMNPKFLSRVP